jgi:RHH-type rel operon transcriptional repressor/antitoxin RelB
MKQVRLDHPAVTLSVRVSPKMRNQLEALSDATGRTKSFLAAEAIKSYLAMQIWQINSIKKAVKKANSKGTKFIDHNKVVDWINSWGNEDEQEIPK